MRNTALSLVVLAFGCTFQVPGLGGFGDGGEPEGGADLRSIDLRAPSEPADLSIAPSSVDLVRSAPLELRINVNGPQHVGVDHPGIWGGDPGAGGVCDGFPFSTSDAVHNTNDGVLFQNEMHRVTLTCIVGNGVLPPGTYKVTLYFAEILYGPGCLNGQGGVGSRVFDVQLEGVTVLTGLDVFKEGGCAASLTDPSGHPVVKTFNTAINDGKLNIVMPATTSSAMISAIEAIGPL